MRSQDEEKADELAHRGDPCIFCGEATDILSVGGCPGTREALAVERDRLRALVARMHAWVDRQDDHDAPCPMLRRFFSMGEYKEAIAAGEVFECQCERGTLLADPDGQAAAEWHVAAVRAAHVEESEACLSILRIAMTDPSRPASFTAWLDGEREKAREEGRLAAMEILRVPEGLVPDLLVVMRAADKEGERRGREEGRKEGITFAANVERHGGTMGEGMEIECAPGAGGPPATASPAWVYPGVIHRLRATEEGSDV